MIICKYLYCFEHINTILYRTVQFCEQSQRRVYNRVLLNPGGLKENDKSVDIQEIFLTNFSLSTYSCGQLFKFYCWFLLLCLAQKYFPSNFNWFLGFCLLCHLVLVWLEMLSMNQEFKILSFGLTHIFSTWHKNC